MSPQLDDAMSNAWLARQKEAAKRSSGGMGTGAKHRMDLSGKNAVVEPGSEIVSRLLPRWDVAEKYKIDLKTKRTIVDPDYMARPPEERFPFFESKEHWWDTSDGKTTRCWCPRTFGADESCPVCERSDELKASKLKAERDVGYRIAAKDVFLFNAVLGKAGARSMNEEGKPDIKYIPCNNSLFTAISQVMTGGGEQEKAFGDITDPAEGYDMRIIRPAAGSKDKWSAVPMPRPSPLYTKDEREAWAGWHTEMLLNLPDLVQGEMESYDDLLARFNEEEPPAGEQAPDPEPGGDDTPPGGPEPGGEDTPHAAADETDPWGFGQPAASGAGKAAPAKAAAGKAAAGKSPAGKATGRPAGRK